MQVQIDGEESQVLRRILTSAWEELREEVHHSKGHEFRAELKHREATIERLLGKLEKARATSGLSSE